MYGLEAVSYALFPFKYQESHVKSVAILLTAIVFHPGQKGASKVTGKMAKRTLKHEWGVIHLFSRHKELVLK